MVEKDSRKAWFIIAVTWCTVVLATISTYGSLSILSYTWIKTFGLSTDQIGWISAVLSVMFVIGPLVNMLVRSLGFWKAVLLSTVLSTSGIIATAFATEFWHLILSYSVLVGAGSAINGQTTPVIVNSYFDKRKSLVYALSQGSTSLGLLIGPAVMEQLIQRIGFLISLVGLSVLVLISGCVVAAVHFIFPREATKEASKEESEKATTDIKISDTKQEASNDKDVEAEKYTEKSSGKESKSDFSAHGIKKGHQNILRDYFFYLILLSYLIAGMSQSVFMTYIVDFAVSSGYITSELAAFGQTTYGVAALVSAVILGALMKFNKLPVVFNMATVMISGISMFCFPLVKTIMPFFALNFISGCSETLRLANVMSHVKKYSNTHIDTRIAYILGCNGLGFVLGPIIAAQVIKITDIQSAFYVAGGFSFSSSVLSIPILFKTYCVKSDDKCDQSTSGL